ncbi:MAG: hypothetical protein F6J87_01875 [Spirulina sp. SIO3F2]|nr:hypothetical protein [Spirulina sp. SIO3F2]
MRFRYSTPNPSQDEFDSLPYIPLILTYQSQSLEVTGLVDSGSTVSVLPNNIGMALGAMWDDTQAIIPLAGSLSRQQAMPLFINAEIPGCGVAKLAFAWARTDDIPIILGQTNFFMEFDIFFYRSQFEFEFRLKAEQRPSL